VHRRKCLWCTVYTSTLRNVLSDRPKTAAVCDGSHKFLGSEFHNIGPATEKARRPAHTDWSSQHDPELTAPEAAGLHSCAKFSVGIVKKKAGISRSPPSSKSAECCKLLQHKVNGWSQTPKSFHTFCRLQMAYPDSSITWDWLTAGGGKVRRTDIQSFKLFKYG